MFKVIAFGFDTHASLISRLINDALLDSDTASAYLPHALASDKHIHICFQ